MSSGIPKCWSSWHSCNAALLSSFERAEPVSKMCTRLLEVYGDLQHTCKAPDTHTHTHARTCRHTQSFTSATITNTANYCKQLHNSCFCIFSCFIVFCSFWIGLYKISYLKYQKWLSKEYTDHLPLTHDLLIKNSH